MAPQARLLVAVQDHERNSITDAEVRLTDPDGDEWSLEYDEGLLRYLAEGLAPGRYELHVSGPDEYAEDHRELDLEPGENRVRSTLGPGGMSSYRAKGGEEVFFHRGEGEALLFVHGEGAEEAAADIVESEGFDAEPLEDETESQTMATRGPGRAEGRGGETAAAEHDEWRPQRPRDDEVALLVERSDEDEGSSVASLLDAIDSDVLPESAVLLGEQPRGRGRGRDGEPRVRIALPMYRQTDDERSLTGLTDEIVVKFEPGVDEMAVEALADEYGFEVAHETSYAENGYLLRREGGPDYDILDALSELNDREEVVYAEPNVAIQLEFQSARPNDFLYPEQPHFGLVDAAGGWDLLEAEDGDRRYGRPDVTIAVADSGVDPTHDDLTGTLTDGSEKLVRSFDFARMTDQNPAALTSDHGTCSASSAAARTDNEDGVGGVAGNCRVIGMRVLARGVTLDEIANSWLWSAGLSVHTDDPGFPTEPPADKADVISNSWGPRDLDYVPSPIDDALDTLVRDGRNGRGCVVCFSAGNPGYVEMAKYHPFAADPRTIAVGATINENPTDPCTSVQPAPDGDRTGLPAVPDTRTYFSPYGPEVDLVAPSHTSYALDDPHPVVDPITSAVPTDWGDWPGNDAHRTALVTDANEGDTEIRVNDPTGFSAGEYLVVATPGDEAREFRRIDAVRGDRLAVPPLDHDHPAGVSVVTGPNDYERGFGGTSHACPTVAGAAALVLSADPTLTWQEVRDVLQRSADPVDTGQSNPIGQWQDRDGDGEVDFSLWYGHGRLNVRRAIEEVVGVKATASVDNRLQELGQQLDEIRQEIEAQTQRIQSHSQRIEALERGGRTTGDAGRGEPTPARSEPTPNRGQPTGRARGEPTESMGESVEPMSEPRPMNGEPSARPMKGQRSTPERHQTTGGRTTGQQTTGGQSMQSRQTTSATGGRTSDRNLDQGELLGELETALRDVSDAMVELRNAQWKSFQPRRESGQGQEMSRRR